MLLCAIIILLICIALFILTEVVKPNESGEQQTKERLPYDKKNILTKNEKALFRILNDKCKEKNIYVFPKVRMEDYIEVTSKNELSKYRGYIKSRHIDFTLYDVNLNHMAGIELDDRSHDTEKAKKTDALKNSIFETISVPLFRIKTGTNYHSEVDAILNTLFPIPESGDHPKP